MRRTFSKTAGFLAHALLTLAMLFGGRALAEEPAAGEPAQEPTQPAVEEPAGAEDEAQVSYALDLLELEPEYKPLTAQ